MSPYEKAEFACPEITNSPTDLSETTKDAASVATQPASPSPPSHASHSSHCLTAVSNTPHEEALHRAQLSTLRLLAAHVGGALALFLATTDATIVSTSLPTIAAELTATQTQYTWVGVAYMLTQTAFQPLYGRFSDIVGRKTVLYSSILIFAIGSLLCGLAKDIVWLIAARALAGTGGGGIVSSVWVITAEIVEVRSRAKWSQALSITWSCSALAGPLLGGLFSGQEHSHILSWRWGFFLNLPICGLATLVLIPTLHNVRLTKASDASWRALAHRFDFGGLVLFMAGSSCIVVGFSFASETGWAAPSTLVLIIFGIAVLICGGTYEMHTSRDCLFPPSTFKDRTAVIIQLVTFLHNFAFNAGTFYLALFFQAANGSTPIEAGIKMLPYSLGSSLASMPAAWFMSHRQSRSHDTSGQLWIVTSGLMISTIGFGLLMILNESSKIAAQVVFPLVAGIGLGMLFHAPYQVFLRALKPHELATGTSAFFLVRFTGATIGLAVAGAVFDGRTSGRLPSEFTSSLTSGAMDYGQLASIEPVELRHNVMRIVASSIQTVWVVCAPCLGLAFLVALFIRKTNTDDVSTSDCGTREDIQSEKQAEDTTSTEKV